MSRTRSILLAFSLLAAAPAPVSFATEKPAPAPEPRTIDLVLALDTSNSMDGLINSAKARLWDIVNELARAKPTPKLRVALYTYGNDSYSRESGWVRKESDFTSDLDALYTKLTAVRTNGGSEYVARVTKAAVEELAWDDKKDSLRILFIAGNESATQDPQFDSLAMAKAAISKGIMVNTIYCGGEGDAVAAGYAAVAKAADGKFAAIDQEKGVKVVSTPYDSKLAELSNKLNGTYIAYGRQARAKAEEQKASDASAASMGAGVAASRAATKASAMYDASEWDLVDAQKKGMPAAALAPEALPAEMQAMNEKEREEHIAAKSKEREAIQKEIAKVSADRQKFLDEEQKKQAKGTVSLDQALKRSIRAQAESKGFQFE